MQSLIPLTRRRAVVAAPGNPEEAMDFWGEILKNLEKELNFDNIVKKTTTKKNETWSEHRKAERLESCIRWFRPQSYCLRT